MIVKVKVKPKAKRESFEKIGENNYLVAVVESPTKGKVNKVLIKIIAENLNVSPSRIFITAGLKSRNKIIEII